jgi:hypothetical protein
MTLDIDEAKLRHNEFALWLSWTAATLAGMLIGFLPFVPLIDSLDLLLARILIPLWAGLLIGIFQLIALRGFLTHKLDLLVHGVGWALGYALGLLTIQILNKNIFQVLVGYLLFGIIVAVIQWPVMRREIPHAFVWVIATVAGWALGAYISTLVMNVLAKNGPIVPIVSFLVSSVVTALVAGAITGLALIWIVRQPELGDKEFVQS